MSRERATRKERKQRIPFGVHKTKMSLDGSLRERLDSSGKVPRWVNDDAGGGRITQALEGGYDFVTPKGEQIGDPDASSRAETEGSRISRIVGTHEDGTPKRAFLMAIDKDFYEEDFAAKQGEIDKIDEAIRRGETTGRLAENQYIPKEGIKYQP